MDIMQEESGHKGRFVAREGENYLGEITYTMAGDKLIILDHTHVEDEHRGRGVGQKLVTYIVDWARGRKVKILPLCPFASSVFARESQFSDVLS